ncbi:MAG: flavodoxin family protein [Candidatus Thermoplasmatota archaeon]|nr:flavodoxin family protein [Candidatus Thermoplasmatota archaeon]
MPKKVLGILGSPRLQGNTADLLDAVLEGARLAGAEAERLDLATMSIDPCIECRRCDADATCAVKTDDMHKIFTRIRQVDVIVLASPIFFMGVSSQTKAMIDRCQCYWVERFVMHKRAYEGRTRPKGLFVACAGSPKPIVFDSARHTVRAFFAAIDYEYAGDVFLGFTDDPEVSPRKVEALEGARLAGKVLVE